MIYVIEILVLLCAGALVSVMILTASNLTRTTQKLHMLELECDDLKRRAEKFRRNRDAYAGVLRRLASQNRSLEIQRQKLGDEIDQIRSQAFDPGKFWDSEEERRLAILRAEPPTTPVMLKLVGKDVDAVRNGSVDQKLQVLREEVKAVEARIQELRAEVRTRQSGP